MDDNDLHHGVTIAQIARTAGVSVATVSRVVNNSDLVEEKTRKRVKEVIKQTNYVPNKLARGLVRQKSKTIGLIVPDMSNPFFSNIWFNLTLILSLVYKSFGLSSKLNKI